MRYELKRPLQTYLIHALWIIVMLFWTYNNHSEFGRWTLWLMTGLGTISFVYIIIKRNYFEIIDYKLFINEDFFRTKEIDLDKIEKFEIEPGPFSASKIILKDNTKVKYSDGQVDIKELKEFMGQFNILVE